MDTVSNSNLHDLLSAPCMYVLLSTVVISVTCVTTPTYVWNTVSNRHPHDLLRVACMYVWLSTVVISVTCVTTPMYVWNTVRIIISMT